LPIGGISVSVTGKSVSADQSMAVLYGQILLLSSQCRFSNLTQINYVYIISNGEHAAGQMY